MQLTLLTGNKGKLNEFRTILPNVQNLDIDLPEIQELDAHKIIQAKLEAAMQHHEGNFIVEDTSLYVDGLNGLPGPLIKWFLKAVDTDGVYKMAASTDSVEAQAKTIIGYASSSREIHFFEGVIEGKIVEPRGNHGFAWDTIFQPEGYDTTFAEMTAEEKNGISMRKIAIEELSRFLKK